MATNAVYQKQGTAVKWTDTTGDLALTFNNLAAGAGRQGAQKDWGALSTARPTRYKYRLVVQFASTTSLAVGERVDLYWKSGDDAGGTTDYDNDDGTGDIALSSTDKLNNLRFLKSLYVDEVATGVDMQISGEFEDLARHGGPVVVNNASENLVASNNVCYVVVTPVFDDIQAAA